MSARDKKLQTDDCTKLTHHLLIMLPKLLSKVIYLLSCSRCYFNSCWSLTLMFLYMQFSSSCDIVASLMKIPQYFLPECINTQNTQVCLPALVYTNNINGRFQEHIQTFQATSQTKRLNLNLFSFVGNSCYRFWQFVVPVLFLRLSPAWWRRWPQLWSSTPALRSWRLQLEPSSVSVRRGQHGALWPRLPGTLSSSAGWTNWHYCWMTHLWCVYPFEVRPTHLEREQWAF